MSKSPLFQLSLSDNFATKHSDICKLKYSDICKHQALASHVDGQAKRITVTLSKGANSALGLFANGFAK